MQDKGGEMEPSGVKPSQRKTREGQSEEGNTYKESTMRGHQ